MQGSTKVEGTLAESPALELSIYQAMGLPEPPPDGPTREEDLIGGSSYVGRSRRMRRTISGPLGSSANRLEGDDQLDTTLC
jgi:hypothetical protein